ncbi:sodium/hydrogen exchanger [Actinocatenispora thailandica]|uniref:Sodium/hydrogen exchanger n=1 Tax=Actinocatenispora thailandica TaxID=227318 RepID=A0A7R7DTK4_9ACTN|nr:cation:proton antiporter [Actinocatenispora thailandica]BCJ37558.1 sodium/hydrogen exchanger [Actinocatenispora thailandica]
MALLIVVGLTVLVLWALAERGLERVRLTGPFVMLACGVLVGVLAADDFNSRLDTAHAEKVVELILALLLFVDATEVRGGPFGGEARVISRLLFLAMPLSLIAAFVAGSLLLPALSGPVLLMLACIVIPTDFAPASPILRHAAIPVRIRHILNVESGYNDGIVSPIFVFAVSLVGKRAGLDGVEALLDGLWAFLFAAAAGIVVGGGAGFVLRGTRRIGFASDRSGRFAMVLVPLLSYVAANLVEANGFVAAFLAGIVYRVVRGGSRHADLDPAETAFADDVGQLVSMAMWFGFGAVAVLVFSNGLKPALILFGVLAVLVLRLVPVLLCLLRSSLRWRERIAVGVLGPRGTASIVFGFLAFDALPESDDLPPLYAMTVVVVLSIVLYGVVAPPLTARLLRSRRGG